MTPNSVDFSFFFLGRSNATLAVSQAVQDTARLHQAAKLAAAVPLPPNPATTTPGMAGNVGRASVADLFTATPPVFAANAPGDHMQNSHSLVLSRESGMS